MILEGRIVGHETEKLGRLLVCFFLSFFLSLSLSAFYFFRVYCASHTLAYM